MIENIPGFKFRVWSKIFEKFLSNSDVAMTMDGIVYETSFGELMNPERDVVIQYYTGAFDKNGKEIYEGDIIEISQHNPREVKWEDGYFSPLVSSNSSGLFVYTSEYLKVIGNILENPELIEGNQNL